MVGDGGAVGKREKAQKGKTLCIRTEETRGNEIKDKEETTMCLGKRKKR